MWILIEFQLSIDGSIFQGGPKYGWVHVEVMWYHLFRFPSGSSSSHGICSFHRFCKNIFVITRWSDESERVVYWGYDFGHDRLMGWSIWALRNGRRTVIVSVWIFHVSLNTFIIGSNLVRSWDWSAALNDGSEDVHSRAFMPASVAFSSPNIFVWLRRWSKRIGILSK